MERRLEAAIASLPSSYREVLLLVGVEGLPPGEAAVICGVTPETLRQRLHRARLSAIYFAGLVVDLLRWHNMF